MVPSAWRIGDSRLAPYVLAALASPAAHRSYVQALHRATPERDTGATSLRHFAAKSDLLEEWVIHAMTDTDFHGRFTAYPRFRRPLVFGSMGERYSCGLAPYLTV